LEEAFRKLQFEFECDGSNHVGTACVFVLKASKYNDHERYLVKIDIKQVNIGCQA
jgi:hypothetical protein